MVEISPHVALAAEAVGQYVLSGRTLEPPDNLPEELSDRAGVFVCIKKFGELRGCIGTIEPTQPTIAHEIITNAISAATRDPRFLPVEPNDLDHLACSVDVLAPAEPIEDMGQLHPKNYGVIVECGMRRGLLLPNLDGVDTVEDQVSIACKKAAIRVDEPFRLYRFEVKRYY